MRQVGIIAFAFATVACFEESDPQTTGETGDDTTAGVVTSTGSSDDSDTESETTMGTTSRGETTSVDPTTTAADSTGTTAAGSSDDTADGSSSGPGAICGDGELNQPDEACDSTPGCDDACLLENYDCNPLNDAPCGDDLRCGLVEAADETFACMIPGDAALGEACSGFPDNDSACAEGLTCLFNLNTPLCDAGNCCVEYCDLGGKDRVCSMGTTCRQFFPMSAFVGLENLGYCGSP